MSMDLKYDLCKARLVAKQGHYTEDDRPAMWYVVNSTEGNDSFEECLWKAKLGAELYSGGGEK